VAAPFGYEANTRIFLPFIQTGAHRVNQNGMRLPWWSEKPLPRLRNISHGLQRLNGLQNRDDRAT
jgi:hypothetical protein